MRCLVRLTLRLAVPACLLSCCETYSRSAVTAEAAGSSPVAPAIHSPALTETTPISRGHKKAQNRYRKRSLAGQSSGLLHFLRAQECDYSILCIAFLSRNRLSVRIE